jgi:hypothetical protein
MSNDQTSYYTTAFKTTDHYQSYDINETLHYNHKMTYMLDTCFLKNSTLYDNCAEEYLSLSRPDMTIHCEQFPRTIKVMKDVH